MSFPYPPNPREWQAAYTRDQAFRDSEKYGSRISVPVFLCVFVAMTLMIMSVYIFLPNFFGHWPGMVNVLRVLIPIGLVLLVVISLWLPERFAKDFFMEFHRPPATVDLSQIIKYRLYGKTKLPPPLNMFSQFEFIMVNDGKVDKMDKWPSWMACTLGGPALLVIFDGNALYLERGNRFSRVVGPGDKTPFLEWYETIKYVVDLRPKVKQGTFSVWTKDGIKITMEARAEYRIGNPLKTGAVSNLVYPYDSEAVKKAVERLSLRWPDRNAEAPSEFDWGDAAWGQVTSVLPDYIGSRTLDELFLEKKKGGQIMAAKAMQEIVSDLNKATNPFGVYVTGFQIQKIVAPPEVEEQQKNHWKAERQSIATVRSGQAKAFDIRSQEKARAEAQRDLILAIANGLEKHKGQNYSEALLLSLSGILDTSLKDPLMRAYLAKETLDTLEKLRTMLH